jgi:hypothetical protein
MRMVLKGGQSMDAQFSHAFALLDEKLKRGEPIDMPSVVTELENTGLRTADAFEELLNDPTAFNWHYYALAGMRTLAALGKLPRDKAWTLLEKTERVAWQMGIDEFYKTIDAVVHSPETVPALLDFVEKRLLGQRDIPEWRWLAFTAVALTLQSETEEIISALRDRSTLKERLRQETGKEDDPARNWQLEAIVGRLP